MEKPKTQAEVRKQKFQDDARRARELGAEALRAIDQALLDEEQFMSTLRGSHEEIDEAVIVYKATHTV